MKLRSLGERPEGGVSHNPRIRKRVLLEPGEATPLVQVARAVFPPGEEVGEHAHPDMAELFLVDRGRGVARVDGREVTLEPGVCLLVEPGEVHALRSTGTSELVVTYLGYLPAF